MNTGIDWSLRLLKTVIFILLLNSSQSSKQNLVILPRPVLRYETVDSWEDFEELNWEGNPPPKYFKSGTKLPGEISGSLEGTGIFYFAGNSSVVNQAIYKGNIEDLKPWLLYVKYYLHYRNSTWALGNKRGAYAYPALKNADHSLIKYLNPTKDFQWEDQVIELNLHEAVGDFKNVELGIFNFKDGDYFFIDRIALVQGQYLTIEKIRGLFSEPEKTTTEMMNTTIVTCSPTRNTTEGFAETTLASSSITDTTVSPLNFTTIPVSGASNDETIATDTTTTIDTPRATFEATTNAFDATRVTFQSTNDNAVTAEVLNVTVSRATATPTMHPQSTMGMTETNTEKSSSAPTSVPTNEVVGTSTGTSNDNSTIIVLTTVFSSLTTLAPNNFSNATKPSSDTSNLFTSSQSTILTSTTMITDSIASIPHTYVETTMTARGISEPTTKAPETTTTKSILYTTLSSSYTTKGHTDFAMISSPATKYPATMHTSPTPKPAPAPRSTSHDITKITAATSVWFLSSAKSEPALMNSTVTILSTPLPPLRHKPRFKSYEIVLYFAFPSAVFLSVILFTLYFWRKRVKAKGEMCCCL